MPRGRKRSVLDRIEAKKDEIKVAKNKVKLLEAELRELEDQKKQSLTVALAEAVEEAGLSIEEAIAKITHKA